MKFSLTPADRERLGAPDVLDCDLMPFPVHEAEAVEEATGLDLGKILELSYARIEPVEGSPGVARYHFAPKGMRILIWLGLRRADVHVDFATLTFDVSPFAGFTLLTPEEDEAPQGKAPRSRSGGRTSKSTPRTSSPRTRSTTSKASTS